MSLSLQEVSISRPASIDSKRVAIKLGLGGSPVREASPLPGLEEEFKLEIFRLIFHQQIEVPKEMNPDSWDLLQYFHPNGVSLTTTAREFKLVHQKALSQPDFKLCYPISLDFHHLLLERGAVSSHQVDAGDVRVVFGPYGSDWHAWNLIGNIGMDWTFGQFVKDAPTPSLFSIRDRRFNQEKGRDEFLCEGVNIPSKSPILEWRCGS